MQKKELKQFKTMDSFVPEEHYITDIKFAGGDLYFSVETGGLFKYDTKENNVENYIIQFPANTIYQFTIVNDSTPWLATGSGLYELNLETGNYTQYSNIREDPLSLESTTVKFVFVDNEQNLWVSSDAHGVNYGLNDIMFKNFMYAETVPYCLTRKEVVSIDFDKRGDLWMGYESGLLERHSSFPLSKTQYHLYSEDGNPGTAFRVYEDSKNRIWAGGWHTGLQKFNSKSASFEPAPVTGENGQYLRQANVIDILESPDNYLWVSTSGFGLIKYNPRDQSVKLVQYDEERPDFGIANNYTTELCFDHENNLWIGSSDGISRIDLSTEKISSSRHNPHDSVSISNNEINTICCDRNGLIWVGTSNGLNLFLAEKNTFKPVKIGYDNLFTSISAIESVNPGEIWGSTKSGLFCLTYTLPVTDDSLKYNVRYFKDSNGLISNVYFNRSSTTDDGGLIYFGGNEGVDFFNTEEKEKMVFNEPKAVITGLSVYGKTVYPDTIKMDKNIPFYEFSYDQRMISIRFTSLNFTTRDQQKYRYRLEGFDKQWVFPENEKVAIYTNLSQGNYFFTVQTTDKDGKWST